MFKVNNACTGKTFTGNVYVSYYCALSCIHALVNDME